MRCSVVLFALAFAGPLVLLSCVAHRSDSVAQWQAAPGPLPSRLHPNLAQTQTPVRIPLRPEVLNVGPTPLAYSSAAPTPWRAVTVRPGPPPFPVAPPPQHVVAPGETLYAIARTRLGDEERWRDIMDANPGLRPSELKAGQRLNIPR